MSMKSITSAVVGWLAATVLRLFGLSAVATIIVVVFWLFLSLSFFPLPAVETSRWTLSALAQSAAALLGLVLVAAAFVRQRSGDAESKLTELRVKYFGLLSTGKAGWTVSPPWVVAMSQQLGASLAGMAEGEEQRTELAGDGKDAQVLLQDLRVLSGYVAFDCDQDTFRRLRQECPAEFEDRDWGSAVEFFQLVHSTFMSATFRDLVQDPHILRGRRIRTQLTLDGVGRLLGDAGRGELLGGRTFFLVVAFLVGGFLASIGALMLATDDLPRPVMYAVLAGLALVLVPAGVLALVRLVELVFVH